MKGFYTEAELQGNGGSENFLVVRSDTFKGSWQGLYKVSSDGSCRLWQRTVRWEPRAAIRARVSASLGSGKGVQP